MQNFADDHADALLRTITRAMYYALPIYFSCAPGVPPPSGEPVAAAAALCPCTCCDDDDAGVLAPGVEVAAAAAALFRCGARARRGACSHASTDRNLQGSLQGGIRAPGAPASTARRTRCTACSPPVPSSTAGSTLKC